MEPRPPTAPPSSGEGTTVEGMRRRVKHAEQTQRDTQEPLMKELQRQRRELETLRLDNEHLKQQLNELRASEVTTSTVGGTGFGAVRVKSAAAVKKSKELDSKRDMLQHLEMRLAEAHQRVQDLEGSVENNRSHTMGLRRRMGGVNATRERHESVDRQVQVLENRLDQSLVRFNEVLRQNKALRDDIDTLRGERDVFETIYRRLEAALQERKKEMAFVIEVSNIAYEERDNNAQVLQSLKAFAAEEMATFAATFKELDDLMESDRRTKEQVKQRIGALEKREQQRVAEERSKAGAKGMGGTEHEEQTTAAEAQAQAYEEAFARLRQATDIPDLGQLVQRFLSAEEENFSLYAYVNDLGKTIEQLERQRTDVIAQIDVAADGSDDDRARRTALRALEDRLRAEERANQQFVDLTAKATSSLHGIMTTVEGLFGRLDCDASDIVARHGVAGLTLDTLLLYVAAIERRAEQHVAEWAQQNGIVADGGTLSRGPLVPMEAAQVVVDARQLPTTGEDADFSDHDDYPLSREELLRRVQRRMQHAAVDRRTVRGAGGGPKGIRGGAVKK